MLVSGIVLGPAGMRDTIQKVWSLEDYKKEVVTNLWMSFSKTGTFSSLQPCQH